MRPVHVLFALSLLVARASAQAPLCQTDFAHPVTGDPTTLTVRIDGPLPGSEIREFAPGCPATVTVGGLATAVGIPPRFDFYLVIDVSTSTGSSSGVDVDGDGRHDSILEAEFAAARAFVGAIDLSNSRVAVITFSNVGTVRLGLTSDLMQLLRVLHSPGTGGGTNYADALATSLQHHLGFHDPTREQVILFLSDGDPTRSVPPPPPGSPCNFPFDAADCAGILWSEEAARQGIVVNTFAVGLGASPGVLQEMAVRGHGQFVAIDVAGEIVDALPRMIHVGVRDVLVRNVTTGDDRIVTPGPDGRFSAPIPVTDGLNELLVTARALEVPSWETTCATDVTTACIAWSCPAPRDEECAAHSVVSGFAASSSHAGVDVAHDSAHADAAGADASGAYPLGRTDVSWTFTDALAGTRTCSSSVTLTDTQAPALTGVPPGGTFPCVAPAGSPAAHDACDPAPTVSLEEIYLPGPCPDRFEMHRTWTATDASGHATTAEQHVIVTDDVPPILSGVPADAVFACGVPIPSPVVAVSDDCDPAAAIDAAETRVDGPCPATYRLLRTWIGTDRCGNAASASQVVDVADSEAPALSGVPADAVADCAAVPPPATVTAADTCSAVVVAFAEDLVPGACPGSYRLVRTWTATDACGNASTASQEIVVQDTTPPAIVADAGLVRCLWPPRHDVHVLGAADFGLSFRDDCSGPVTWRFDGCSPDQPDDALGDGSTSGDCVVSADGATLQVRSERQGRGRDRHVGRTYSVSVVAVDACGNATPPTPAGRIAVPHDQSDHDRTCGR